MKATEVLKKAKELLSIETEEVKLAQAKLKNGTVIEAEQMAEGQEVFIITEDEKVALPVGEYTLEDGQILTVKEEGIIASIEAAKEEEAAEEDLSEEQQLEEDKEEMKYATKEELSEVKKMIEEIKAMIDKKEDMASEEVDKKEELSEVPKVKHNPEKETEKQTYLFSQKSGTTTLDRVLNKISNN
jgi:hypothetical protein